MKKILSLVLVLSMVLGSFGFVFAAEEADFSRLTENNILLGDAEGNLMLDQQLTRAQFAVLALRLKGFEDAAVKALDEKADFTDVAADAWFAPFVGLAAKEGLMKGMGDGTFAPKANVAYVEVLTVLLRILGYDTTGLAWPMGVYSLAVTAGLVDTDVAVDEEVTREQMAETMEGALDLPMTGETVTLAQDLGIEIIVEVVSCEVAEDGKSITVLFTDDEEVVFELDSALVANEETEVTFKHAGLTFTELVTWEVLFLDVLEATTENLIQITVSFTSDVEANEEAAKKGNYKVMAGNTALTVDDVALSGNTAVLTLLVADNRDQQDTVKLTVSDKIVEVEEREITVAFLDTTIPSALNAEIIGNDTIKVYFSEPMETAPASAFKIDGGAYHIRSVTLLNNNTEANVELYAKLTGEKVEVEVGTAVKDFAGFSVLKETFELSLVKDEAAPVIIGFKDATPLGVTLIFDEDIETSVAAANFYHTNTNNAASTVTAVGAELTLVWTETKSLPHGTAYVYAKKDAISDLWGNKIALTQKELVVEIDETKPVLDKIVVVDENTIRAEFSENVDSAIADDKANYTILDKDGEKVDNIISTITVSGKNVTINFRRNLSGDHSLAAEKVADLANNVMDATTMAFDVTDKTRPDFSKFTATIFTLTASHVVEVKFGEAMATEGEFSVLDERKYNLSGSGVVSALTNASIVIKDNGKTVHITIPRNVGNVTPAAANMTLARVADAAGNYTEAFSGTVSVASQGRITYDAKATGTKVIVLTFSDYLSTFNGNDFYAIGITGSATTTTRAIKTTTDVNAAGNTVATLEFDISFGTDLNANGVTGVSVGAITTPASMNAFGERITTVAVSVTDEVAPAIAVSGTALKVNATTGAGVITVGSVTTSGAHTLIEIEHTEAINDATLGVLNYSVVNSAGTAQTILAVDVVSSSAVTMGVVRILLGTNFAGEELRITQNSPIADIPGNQFTYDKTITVTP